MIGNAMSPQLKIDVADFSAGLKPFQSRKRMFGTVLLAFEGGFLSLETDAIKTVMRASGQWHGRARFSAEILRALALVPPTGNPVIMSYAQGHLLIGNMTIACTWIDVRKESIAIDVEAACSPGIIDVLAMDRTARRVDANRAEMRQQIRSAKEKMARRIKNAVEQLSDLGISEAEIRALVESKIVARIESEGGE